MGRGNALSLETCFIKVKLDQSSFHSRAVGEVATTESISAGGVDWTIACYPRGHLTCGGRDTGKYASLGVTGSTGENSAKVVKATFHAFVLGRDGSPSFSFVKSKSECNSIIQAFLVASRPDYTRPGGNMVLDEKILFMARSQLESHYLIGGCITFICGLTILPSEAEERGRSIPVPGPDLGTHLGGLLDCAAGSDVSFSVGGETFAAHRAVLAARSPVFKAQLLGSMADATSPCVTLQGIHPATFQTLLRFAYTDALPADREPVRNSVAVMALLQSLLAAADMYDMERLKLLCARRLWEEHVSTETVASILCSAELHNCVELKKACIDFFLVKKNFNKVVLTEGYLRLMQSSPSLIEEIRGRIGD